jgi:hypothetical protein
MGAPRSGTTYLTEVLNVHPDVYIGPEIRLFDWVHQSLNLLTAGEQSLRTSTGGIRLDVARPRDRAAWAEHLRRSYPGLIRDFFQMHAPHARYWGDKNLHYAKDRGCLDTIGELFPGTRFVHVVRDGRDVVTSLLRLKWVDWDRAHRSWTTHVDTARAFGESQPPGRYLEVRYEDLVRDDAACAARLFAALGIDLHPDVVAFCDAQHARRTPFSRATRDLGSGATTSDWSTWLTPTQQLASLRLLGPHLVKFGYETEASLRQAEQDLTVHKERKPT